MRNHKIKILGERILLPEPATWVDETYQVNDHAKRVKKLIGQRLGERYRCGAL